MRVFHHDGLEMASVTDFDAALAAADCVIIVANHSVYDWPAVHRQAHLVVDTTLHQMQGATA